ncbi:DUF302 domain-containing protein [Flagellimonas sp.]|uniref:DUF302 domain-containing protein n=1 Tax=Flagellimonas sp. TaxID=2058762 RepID=UPI003BA87199
MAKNEEHKKKTAQQNYRESMNTSYCVRRRYNLTFEEAIDNVKNQLKKSGLDIVSEFDVKEYLGSIMKDMPNHFILLVCDRNTASELIANDIQMGILFPCNVTIKEVEDKSVVEVSMEDTSVTWSSSLKKDVEEIAKKTKENLEKVLSNIGPTNVKL